MSDDLYERYKSTLRAGHVALLRGSLDEAAVEYRSAAEIAPARALPHTSLGGVYIRLGHLQDALTEYTEAVKLAPADEGALLGLAEALSVAGQRVDAASALDRVAEVQEASGRLPEAADTLRRALELEDTIERLQRHRALLRQIRLSDGDQAAEQLLARALRLREEPPPTPPARSLKARTDELVTELTRLAASVTEAAALGSLPLPPDVVTGPAPEPVETTAAGTEDTIATEPAEPVMTALAAWSVEDESVVAEAAAAEIVAEPGGKPTGPEPAVAIEDMLSIDGTTLEEALSLRMQALSGDSDLGDPGVVGAEPAPEPEAVLEPAAQPEPAIVPEPELAAESEPEAIAETEVASERVEPMHAAEPEVTLEAEAEPEFAAAAEPVAADPELAGEPAAEPEGTEADETVPGGRAKARIETEWSIEPSTALSVEAVEVEVLKISNVDEGSATAAAVGEAGVEAVPAPGITTASEFAPEPEASEAIESELVAAGPTPDSESYALPDEVEPPVVAVMQEARVAATRGSAEVQQQPTGDELLGAAEAAEASGDLKNLRSLLVWTARAYAREGRFEAALDAAHRLLQRYPGDVDAHLVLVELYVARDWDVLAVEKLGLLDRLARLGDDVATHDRLRAVAARAFPSDPRVDGILGDLGAVAGGA
jgi:tetratricopeptide (TPR) repeat protein